MQGWESKTPSSRGGGEAEELLAVNPGPGQLVAMETAGRRRPTAGLPRGAVPGSWLPPREGVARSRHLGPGAPGSRSHENSALVDRGDHKSPAAV